MNTDKLDFVGFGALNVDLFYLLRHGRTVEQVVSGLRPGGEIIGSKSEREQILSSVREHATCTGRSGGGQAANGGGGLSEGGRDGRAAGGGDRRPRRARRKADV